MKQIAGCEFKEYIFCFLGTDVENFYLLKINLNLFEIPNQVLKFENVIQIWNFLILFENCFQT